MPDKSVLDLTRLEEAFEDDVGGIAELLEMALDTGEKHRLNLHEGIAARDLAAVSRAAHSIKGSASNIGAERVAACAAQIEERVRDESWADVPQLASGLDAAYAALRDAVAAYRARITSQSP
jgi:HPt (histidine-containing phosphotransfer) domain-containing protein